MAVERRHVKMGDMTAMVEVEVEPTDTPWDGDYPLDPKCEGWDVVVKAILELGNGHLGPISGHASLCGTWVYPDADGRKYLEEVTQELVAESVRDLEEKLALLAKGESVNLERRRQRAARRILALIPVQEVCES